MGCSNTAENQADKMDRKVDNVQDDLDAAAQAKDRDTYESERRSALDRLYGMRANIDRELVDVDERLATKDMKQDKRAEQQALKAELGSQQAEVGRMITKVENSQQGTWISVKEDTRSGSDKVEDWWKRTKDNSGNRNRSDMDNDNR